MKIIEPRQIKSPHKLVFETCKLALPYKNRPARVNSAPKTSWRMIFSRKDPHAARAHQNVEQEQGRTQRHPVWVG